MNHSKMMLTITAIVAAAALVTVAYAAPQQVMAYRHHHHHNDNHKSRVDQQVNQENNCSDSVCANDGQNNYGPLQPQVVWNNTA
jgi:hypothetical protein